MNRQAGHQHKTGPFDKFFLSPRPFNSLLIGRRGLIKEIRTALIADIPGVEIFRPSVHLFSAHLYRVINHSGKDAGLVDPESHNLRARRWSFPVSFAIRLRSGIEIPRAFSGLIPNRAIPATASGLDMAFSFLITS